MCLKAERIVEELQLILFTEPKPTRKTSSGELKIRTRREKLFYRSRPGSGYFPSALTFRMLDNMHTFIIMQDLNTLLSTLSMTAAPNVPSPQTFPHYFHFLNANRSSVVKPLDVCWFKMKPTFRFLNSATGSPELNLNKTSRTEGSCMKAWRSIGREEG